MKNKKLKLPPLFKAAVLRLYEQQDWTFPTNSHLNLQLPFGRDKDGRNRKYLLVASLTGDKDTFTVWQGKTHLMSWQLSDVTGETKVTFPTNKD